MQKSPRVGPAEEASPLSQEAQAKGDPSQDPHVPQGVWDTTNWCCTVTGLLCICAILLFLVATMVLKVELLEQKTSEETDLWQWKFLTLTEILRDLQIGKVPSCSVCKVQWVQQGNRCFLFRDRPMGWHSSQGFCQDENANLVVPRDTDEMTFLKFYSNKHHHLNPELYEYDKYWIGLSYDVTQGRWLWVDETPFNSTLFGKLDHKGCAYLQNGTLYSQNCNEVAKIICKTSIQRGWT